MTKAEFLEMAKLHMRNNKNHWLNGTYIVDGHLVQIKMFNKYIQIMYVDGLYCGGCEFKTQKAVIEYLQEAVA